MNLPITKTQAACRTICTLALVPFCLEILATSSLAESPQEAAGQPPHDIVEDLGVTRAEDLPDAIVIEGGRVRDYYTQEQDCDPSVDARCNNNETDVPMICVVQPPLSEVCPAGDGFWSYFAPDVFPCSEQLFDLEAGGNNGLLLGRAFERTARIDAENDNRSTEEIAEICGIPRSPDPEPGEEVLTGCFPLDAEIQMADGLSRAAEEIFVGDRVFNPFTGKSARVQQVVESREHQPLIEFGDETATTRVTQTHPVWTERGLKQARKLQLGDRIRMEDGSIHEISVLRNLPVNDNQRVINFVLASDGGADAHFLIADGVVTGDLHLQRMLAQAGGE